MRRIRISTIFFQGLAAVVPLAVSLAAVWWLGHRAEAALGGLFRQLLPHAYYVPGMGVAAGIALVFLVGLLLELWLVRRLFRFAEALFERIPLLKTIYGAVQDLLGFFRTGPEANRQVVAVTLGPGMEILGIVTREDFRGLPAEFHGEGRVAVYLPMSYQIGGFTLFVPKSAIRPIPLSVEEAMRFAVTAGLSGEARKADPKATGREIPVSP